MMDFIGNQTVQGPN